MAGAPRPRRKPLESTESIPFSPTLVAADEPAPRADPARRMLLIEDTDELRRLTADRFRALGWDVVAARDVRTAIELAMTVQPNAIVTELILPDVRGYYFARTLRSVVDHDVQVVAVTLSLRGSTACLQSRSMSTTSTWY